MDRQAVVGVKPNIEGPLYYAKPALRAQLELEVDENSARPLPKIVAAELVALDRIVRENNKSTNTLHDVEEVAPSWRLPPIVARYETRQEEVARLMLDMTYGEFVVMTDSMKVDPKVLHAWARGSIRKLPEV